MKSKKYSENILVSIKVQGIDFFLYLQETENWESLDLSEILAYYHKYFPEFRIAYNAKKRCRGFRNYLKYLIQCFLRNIVKKPFIAISYDYN
jgi:hypothetical protein